MFKFVVLALFFGESLALSSSKLQKAVSVDPDDFHRPDEDAMSHALDAGKFYEEDFPKPRVSFDKTTYDSRNDFAGDEMEATMRAAQKQFAEAKDSTEKLININNKERIQAAMQEQQRYALEGKPEAVAAKKLQDAFDPKDLFDKFANVETPLRSASLPTATYNLPTASLPTAAAAEQLQQAAQYTDPFAALR